MAGMTGLGREKLRHVKLRVDRLFNRNADQIINLVSVFNGWILEVP
jgi:hypothetical protein